MKSATDMQVLEDLLTNMLYTSTAQSRNDLKAVLEKWQGRVGFVNALQEESDSTPPA